MLDGSSHLAAYGVAAVTAHVLDFLRQVLEVEETQPGPSPHEVGPVALVPNDHVGTASIDDALAEVAEQVRASGRLPRSAGTDLLLRRPPRLHDGAPLPPADGPAGYVGAITAALRAMDHSTLAVQGPPGTGKTYVGSHVIARLVADGWAVGVTAQSHAAVENVLTPLVAAAGVPADQVGKAGARSPDVPWTTLERADDLAAFAAGHRAAGRGYVVGGTAWDLTNTKRVERGQLDLLVIDEAGQFSLAATIATVSANASAFEMNGDSDDGPGATSAAVSASRSEKGFKKRESNRFAPPRRKKRYAPPHTRSAVLSTTNVSCRVSSARPTADMFAVPPT